MARITERLASVSGQCKLHQRQGRCSQWEEVGGDRWAGTVATKKLDRAAKPRTDAHVPWLLGYC